MLNKCTCKLLDKFQPIRTKPSKGRIYEFTLEENSIVEKEHIILNAKWTRYCLSQSRTQGLTSPPKIIQSLSKIKAGAAVQN